jgi:hypothetical protein
MYVYKRESLQPCIYLGSIMPFMMVHCLRHVSKIILFLCLSVECALWAVYGPGGHSGMYVCVDYSTCCAYLCMCVCKCESLQSWVFCGVNSFSSLWRRRAFRYVYVCTTLHVVHMYVCIQELCIYSWKYAFQAGHSGGHSYMYLWLCMSCICIEYKWTHIVDVDMYMCVYVCMHVCMYVCMYSGCSFKRSFIYISMTVHVAHMYRV